MLVLLNLLMMKQLSGRKERLADEIRDELLEKGIILEDTRQGVKWRRA